MNTQTITTLFNELFGDETATILCGGGNEPHYQPASLPHARHRITFRADFVSSALHEIAHWTIAGKERRLLEDYGYWYEPDGRNGAQQAAFERNEARPQAIEWLLASAAQVPFHASFDNLSGDSDDGERFRKCILREAELLWREGLPPRAARMFHALQERLGTTGFVQDYWQKVLDEHTLPP